MKMLISVAGDSTRLNVEDNHQKVIDIFKRNRWPTISLELNNNNYLEKINGNYFLKNHKIELYVCSEYYSSQLNTLMRELSKKHKIYLIKEALCPEFLNVKDNLNFVSINEVICLPFSAKGNDLSCFENSVSPCEVMCAELLSKYDTKSSSILSIGVGSSYIAKKFHDRSICITGVTVSGKECSVAMQYNNLGNYDCLLVNKYNDLDFRKVFDGKKFDFIIDVNIQSFACCYQHYKCYLKNVTDLLSSHGILMTTRRGMGWGGNSIDYDMNISVNRVGYYPVGNGYNVVSLESLEYDLEKIGCKMDIISIEGQTEFSLQDMDLSKFNYNKSRDILNIKKH